MCVHKKTPFFTPTFPKKRKPRPPVADGALPFSDGLSLSDESRDGIAELAVLAVVGVVIPLAHHTERFAPLAVVECIAHPRLAAGDGHLLGDVNDLARVGVGGLSHDQRDHQNDPVCIVGHLTATIRTVLACEFHDACSNATHGQFRYRVNSWPIASAA